MTGNHTFCRELEGEQDQEEQESEQEQRVTKIHDCNDIWSLDARCWERGAWCLVLGACCWLGWDDLGPAWAEEGRSTCEWLAGFGWIWLGLNGLG